MKSSLRLSRHDFYSVSHHEGSTQLRIPIIDGPDRRPVGDERIVAHDRVPEAILTADFAGRKISTQLMKTAAGNRNGSAVIAERAAYKLELSDPQPNLQTARQNSVHWPAE
jgi:hypothetical protein